MLTEVAIGATLALIVGAFIGYFIDRIRRGSAYQSYQQILKQAELDAENLLKSQKLEAKEELLKRRESLEEEVNKQREELWSVEKKLSKRENALEDQQADFLKKESMIQATQSKLASRTKAVEAREQDAEADRIFARLPGDLALEGWPDLRPLVPIGERERVTSELDRLLELDATDLYVRLCAMGEIIDWRLF